MIPEGPDEGAADPGSPDARALLRRLAGDDAGVVVERAEAAVDDLALAAEFAESVGIDELEGAVARTDDESLAARGARALEAFRRFRAAAAGELDAGDESGRGTVEGRRGTVDGRRTSADDGRVPPDDRAHDGCHFHRGRGTDLRRDGEATST